MPFKPTHELFLNVPNADVSFLIEAHNFGTEEKLRKNLAKCLNIHPLAVWVYELETEE